MRTSTIRERIAALGGEGRLGIGILSVRRLVSN
jgi:hypothetical protein